MMTLLIRLFGMRCVGCREWTLGRLRFGEGRRAFRVGLCEPCHQRELPEVPHP